MVTMTTSNVTTQPQAFPLGSDLTVATINVNGALPISRTAHASYPGLKWCCAT